MSYILDAGCPTCDGPVEMSLEWVCAGDDRCTDPDHELTLLYRCWNDHVWTSDPEDFPGNADRGGLPPEIPPDTPDLYADPFHGDRNEYA